MATPVRLPPGRPRLATRPAATGSTPVSKTIGIVDDARLERSVVAVDERGAVVGSLLAFDAAHPQLWRRLLGDDSGAIAAVGVHERVRNRGAGTALVAFASEQLRDRGVGRCHIGWTDRLSFYGRLGYRPWRRFERATLQLVR